MALKQRTWAILIRPFIKTAEGEFEYYTEMPYRPAKQGSGISQLAGAFEGMSIAWKEQNPSTIMAEGGAWSVFSIETSYEEFRSTMEYALRLHPKNMVRGIEYVSTGTIATPFA